MKEYIKNELKHLPSIIVVFIVLYSLTTFAENTIFNSSQVGYDNSHNDIVAGDIQGAIDELYCAATDYAAYNTRLTTAENNKSEKTATVSTVSWDTTNKKLTKTINGTTTDIVSGATILNGLTKSQVTTALGYTPPTQDTNTWRGIQDNLSSSSTSDCLSANQGRVLNSKFGTQLDVEYLSVSLAKLGTAIGPFTHAGVVSASKKVVSAMAVSPATSDAWLVHAHRDYSDDKKVRIYANGAATISVTVLVLK